MDIAVQANTQRMVIATTQAAASLSFTADATLTVALPTNGQACFRKADTSVKVHCLSWGTITSTVIGVYGTDYGMSPPDGQSLQRYFGSYGIDDPTPGAVNTGIIPDASIVDGPPPDAATQPDGSVGIDAPPDNGNNPGGSDGDDGCNVGGNALFYWVFIRTEAAVAPPFPFYLRPFPRFSGPHPLSPPPGPLPLRS